jgi:hypothetical protein
LQVSLCKRLFLEVSPLQASLHAGAVAKAQQVVHASFAQS